MPSFICLSSYYDFLDYYLSCEDFQILEMDTDSNYLRIAAESVEDFMEPELKEQLTGKNITGLSLHLHPKENILPDSLKWSLKETK